ncbi:MAG: ABC transporter permease [Verrucomicrobia bacterium]|nr:ABC transporter permease [Verrucomicrobiota bacterium]
MSAPRDVQVKPNTASSLAGLPISEPQFASSARRSASGIRLFPEFRILLVVAVFWLAMWIYNPAFLSAATINTVLLYLFGYAIMACGMTVLLVSGGFDLSVGSVSALAAMVAAVLMKEPSIHLAWPLAVVAGLAIGAGTGLFNGLIIAKIGINPFITTLGTMLLARGLTYIISGGVGRSGFEAPFCWLGQGRVAGVQMPIIVSLAWVAMMDVLLRKHRFFRQNYYIGSNERAAWLSGIAVSRVKLFNYALSGTLSALAGLLFTARLDSAIPNAGEGDELKVITAVIVGGASLSGGKGTVIGAFLGCLLLATIRPAISFLNIGDHWEKAVVGGILLAAVMLDRLGRRR